MKITVVVRTYKRPDFLREALASIQIQTHTDWEVLIFDDSASEVNLNIYKNFKKQNSDKNIVFITTDTPHDLFKQSWKLAPKLATGEVIVRLDDDDLLGSDTLSYVSTLYESHPTLDYTYGSGVFFEEYELKNMIVTQHPSEIEKTKTAWAPYTIKNNRPWKDPWHWLPDYYDEPKSYSSIIHASKANIMCVYHTYTMRVSSLLSVIDKFTITSKFVDDLEAFGSLDYLGLVHTSIKRILSYIRIHDTGRVTDMNRDTDDNIYNNINLIRDKVDELRETADFQSKHYSVEIDGNFNEGFISSGHSNYFTQYKKDIEKIARTYQEAKTASVQVDWRKFV